MNSTLISQLTDLVHKHLKDEGTCKTYLITALGTSEQISQQVNWNDKPKNYINSLIVELDKYGNTDSGQLALCDFLQEISAGVGQDVKKHIDDLIEKIKEEKVQECTSEFQKNGRPIKQKSSQETNRICASTIISEIIERKYNLNLTTFELHLYKNLNLQKNYCLNLSITFTTTVANISQAMSISFAIKRGILQLKITNGKMDFHTRESFENTKFYWSATERGLPETPEWEFSFIEPLKSKYSKSFCYLYGGIKEQYLGSLELIEISKCLEIEAIFKTDINRDHIEILCSNDVNKKQKETKLGKLLRFLKKPEQLGNYVSKIIIKVVEVSKKSG
ncbi:hypothetical protein H6H01_35025 [Nostoc calcicola FACHB-3891]|nr:hypothetical protein [Nostoc calcicola FACHB-3891]